MHILVYVLLPALAMAQHTFGRFHSRANFTQAATCPASLVILVPGSGAHGPEEMMPASLTADGKDHSVFGAFSAGLARSGVGTLAIGKPGVNFFKSWDPKDHFYDADLYRRLSWQDLIDNLKDAVDFAKTLPCVDPNRISVLGHSEGTQVAVDFASQYPAAIANLILVGFSGESLATTVDWQLFRRPIDAWLAPDVDVNHDGFISRDEARAWPEFQWTWASDRVSFAEIEARLRSDTRAHDIYQNATSALVWQGVFSRSLYSAAVALPHPLFVFTGALDVQTRPEEATKLGCECVLRGKRNCEITIVPGFGHAMSRPRSPRGQKLLDMTLGPVDDLFLDLLARVGARL